MTATIKDVAEEAGVSITTVSAVINETRYVSPELTERVEEAVEKLNYHPDHMGRGLRKGQSNMVGLVVSDITNPFFPRVVRGAEDRAHEKGYGLILCNTDEDPTEEEQYLTFLRSQRIDGLIIAVTNQGKENIKSLEDNIPLVLIDRTIEKLEIPQVVSENRKGAYEATNYLLDLGHKRIGFVAGIPGIRSTDDRLKGYRSAIEDQGLAVDESLIVMGNSQAEDSYDATKKLSSKNDDLTAIFAANNLITIGVLRYLKENDIPYPDQLSLLCFDDPIWGSVVDKSISVVSQQPYDMGYEASRILINQVTNNREQPVKRNISLPTTLKIRDSTGPPPE